MKCNAVVLAAGYSSRAGTNKMALTIDNQTVIARVIETLLVVCDKIVVVGGYNYESVKGLIQKYDRVKIVENKNYSKGMFSSVKRGVEEMTGDFFLIPGDYPMVKPSTYKTLMSGKKDFIVPTYKGRRGHPVLIKKNLIGSILKEPLDSNLKAFRDKCETEFLEIDDEGILMDIDTMEDYYKIRKLSEGGIKFEN